ncbi:hypothetical protein AALM99_04845 [Lactococcus muris]|uniref:Uncharacterized protein n=1 Tax=Lactococcus muris TaxID=2941330 RepID=A0ABV4D7N9_9LACT
MNKDYLTSPFNDKTFSNSIAVVKSIQQNNKVLLSAVQNIPKINLSQLYLSSSNVGKIIRESKISSYSMEISKSITKITNPAFEIMNAVQKNYNEFVFPLLKGIKSSNDITSEINSLFSSIEFNTEFPHKDIQDIRSHSSEPVNIRLDKVKQKHPDEETQEILRDISTKMEEVLKYTRGDEIKHNISPYANEIQFLQSIEAALSTYASGKILDKLWELDPIFSLVLISFVITFIHIRIKKMSSQ